MSKDCSTDPDGKNREAVKLLAKYPDRVPVICVGGLEGCGLPKIERKKFLVPKAMSGDDLVSIVRKHVDATSNTGISRHQRIQLHVGGTKLLSGSVLVSELYRQHADSDGFLYVAYAPFDETAGVAVKRDVAEMETSEKGSDMKRTVAAKMRAKHPNHLPVICREASALNLFEQGKKKFLIPIAMTSNEFKAVVQSNVDERATELNLPKRSIAVSVAGSPVPTATSMEEIYKLHVSEDDFLYIQCSVKEDSGTAAEVMAESTNEEVVAGKVEVEEVRRANLLDLQTYPVKEERAEEADLLDLQAGPTEKTEASFTDLHTEPFQQPSALLELAAEAGEAQEESETCSESGCTAQPQSPEVPGPMEPPSPPPPPPPPPLMPGPKTEILAKRCEESTEAHAVKSPPPSLQAAPEVLECVGSEAVATPSMPRQLPTDLDSTTAPQAEGSNLSDVSLPGRGATDCGEATRLRQRYPHRVPVICERAPRADLPDIQKKKFLVPSGMLCSEFKYIIHRQIKQAGSWSLAADQTIYLFVQHTAGSTSPKGGTTMAELYDVYCASDGFLHLSFSAENTLGAGMFSRECFPHC